MAGQNRDQLEAALEQRFGGLSEEDHRRLIDTASVAVTKLVIFLGSGEHCNAELSEMLREVIQDVGELCFADPQSYDPEQHGETIDDIYAFVNAGCPASRPVA